VDHTDLAPLQPGQTSATLQPQVQRHIDKYPGAALKIKTDQPIQLAGQFRSIIAPGAKIHLKENSELVVSRRINIDSVTGDRGSSLVVSKGRVGNLAPDKLCLIGAGKILGKIFDGKLGTILGRKLRENFFGRLVVRNCSAKTVAGSHCAEIECAEGGSIRIGEKSPGVRITGDHS
jgi:hypothetical protein